MEHGTVADILCRARAAGVGKIITVGTAETDWEKHRSVAQENDEVYFSTGLHPHEAVRWPEVEAQFLTFFQNPSLKGPVAVGEIGLDFHYNFAPREAQIVALEAQLSYAKQFHLPVILHCRDAFEALFDSIRRVGLSERGGVMHCFTGNAEEAKGSLALGLKISFSGILTFKNAEPLRDAAKIVPAESLLVETDCPYLSPVPLRGKPNEPSHLPHTARTLATLRGVDAVTLAEQTTENAIKLFKLH